MSLENRLKTLDYKCEVCGSNSFYQYDYPTDPGPRRHLMLKSEIRRYFANSAKFVLAHILFWNSSNPKLIQLKKRAQNTFNKIKSPKKIARALRNVNKGFELFEGKKIIICSACDLGTIYPKLSEETLVKFYSQDYWVAESGDLETCENNRTTSTYKLLKEQLNFADLKTVLEFGSASAQLSRYIQTHEKSIVFDCVDPGIVWQEKLKPFIRNIYLDIKKNTGKYDMVCGSHSLEHVPDIADYFGYFVNLLNPRGYLYFEIPNSVEKERIFGAEPDYHFPHTYFYTPKSFEKLAEKFGLEIVFTKTFSQSYTERFAGKNKHIDSTIEHPDGAYLRVLLRKK